MNESQTRKIRNLLIFLVMALQESNVIELLSSEIENNALSPSTTNLLSGETDYDYENRKRKRIARVLILVTGVFLLLSCLLVGISLNMTKVIDEKVRHSNSLLHKSTTNKQSYDSVEASKSINDTMIPP